MNLINKMLRLLYSHDKKEVTNFCASTATPKSVIDGYKLQDTAYGCNGDIVANNNTALFVSHTNPKHAVYSKTDWKDNRVEIAKEIDKVEFDWSFKVSFYKLPTTSDWVIFSQLWNRVHDNVLSLVVKKSTKRPGKVKLELTQKQNKKSTILWYGYFDQYKEHDIKLTVGANGVVGTINNVDVGIHVLEVFTSSPQEVKYGVYFSSILVNDKSNQMFVGYKL